MEVEPVLTVRCCEFPGELDDKDNPTFLVKVCMRSDGLLSYEVQRSYTDFIEFDGKIRRSMSIDNLVFPSHEQSLIQRSASDTLEKKESRQNLEVERNDYIVLTMVESLYTLIHSYCQHSEIIDIETRGNAESLDFYLQDILSRHEIVASDEFLSFLDPEITPITESTQLDYLFDLKDISDARSPRDFLSVPDILLRDVTPTESRVKDNEIYSSDITAGQTLVWKFKTIGYQTGLTVKINGVPKMFCPNSFTDKSASPVCGEFRAEENGFCTLFWTPIPASSTYV